MKFDPAFELYTEGCLIYRKCKCITIGFLFSFFSSQSTGKKTYNFIDIIKILWSEFYFKCFMPLSHLNVLYLTFFILFSITAEPLNLKIYISAILLYKWQVQSHIIFFFFFFFCVCTESLKHIRLLRDLKNNV